ncbi:MAG: nuclear transport factor 2 family protein [Acidobacteria bacterium]|nr:nuclear transport factor 2 family protein [Acidobacteriota bacterium]
MTRAKGLRERIQAFRAKYSGIMSRLEATATEPSSGKPIRMLGMNTSRFRDGKIASRGGRA